MNIFLDHLFHNLAFVNAGHSNQNFSGILTLLLHGVVIFLEFFAIQTFCYGMALLRAFPLWMADYVL